LRTLDPVWLAALNHLVTAIVLAPFAARHAHVPQGIQWLLLACVHPYWARDPLCRTGE
jgi:hypothetical protein